MAYTSLNKEQRYRLIELVKERPVLYDKRHRLFRSVKEKEYRWREIAKMCNKSELACKKAWKTLRDQYHRFMRMPHEKRRKYRYLNELSFLGNDQQKFRNRHEHGLMELFSDSSDYSDDIEPKSTGKIYVTESTFNKPENGFEHEEDTLQSQFSEIDHFIYSKSSEQRISSALLSTFNNLLNKRYELQEDENDIFFRMLAKKMKNLPEDVKHRLQECFLEQINQETDHIQQC